MIKTNRKSRIAGLRERLAIQRDPRSGAHGNGTNSAKSVTQWVYVSILAASHSNPSIARCVTSSQDSFLSGCGGKVSFLTEQLHNFLKLLFELCSKSVCMYVFILYCMHVHTPLHIQCVCSCKLTHYCSFRAMCDCFYSIDNPACRKMLTFVCVISNESKICFHFVHVCQCTKSEKVLLGTFKIITNEPSNSRFLCYTSGIT